MREGEDEEIRARDLDWRAPPDQVIHCISAAFQWLPGGICQESTFNCFIAKESVSLHPVTIQSIPRRPSDFRRPTQLLLVVCKEVKLLLETASAQQNEPGADVP